MVYSYLHVIIIAIIGLICRVNAFSSALTSLRMMGGGAIRGDKLPYLTQMIEARSIDNCAIIELINDISQQNIKFIDQTKLDGDWDLLWTNDAATMKYCNSKTYKRYTEILDYSVSNSRKLQLTYADNSMEIISSNPMAVDVSNSLRFNIIDTNKSNKLLFQLSTMFTFRRPTKWLDILYVNNVFKLAVDNDGYYSVSRRSAE